MFPFEKKIKISYLGLQDYSVTHDAMRDFSCHRGEQDADQLWLLQHPAVFTQGSGGKAEHILHPSNIPIIKSDRGGQVTYHGPGQLVGYCLINLRRQRLTVRQLVALLENSLIAFLNENNIDAHTIPQQPGVYVAGDKIASLGLRIHKGCSYHGFSININMDISPFTLIRPCGIEGLTMTQMADWGYEKSIEQSAERVGSMIQKFLLLPATDNNASK